MLLTRQEKIKLKNLIIQYTKKTSIPILIPLSRFRWLKSLQREEYEFYKNNKTIIFQLLLFYIPEDIKNVVEQLNTVFKIDGKSEQAILLRYGPYSLTRIKEVKESSKIPESKKEAWKNKIKISTQPEIHKAKLGEEKYNEMILKKTNTKEKLEEKFGIGFTKIFSVTLENQIKKYGVIEGEKKYFEYLEKLKNTTSLNKKYYMEKGLSEEEAKLALSERQRTFTLEKCIEKYGYDEGVFVWQKRQEKWQSTLDLKTTKEKEEINLKKSVNDLDYFIKKYGDTEQARILYEDRCNRTGYCMKPPLNEDIPGKLYYIRFWNKETEFWKIGITKNSIEERFEKPEVFKVKHDLNYEIIFIKDGGLYHDCYIEEQRLLKENRANRISINYNGFKTSEAFKKDILCQN